MFWKYPLHHDQYNQPDLRHHLYLSGSGTADHLTAQTPLSANGKNGGKEILPHGYTKGEAGKSVNCPTVLIPW